MGNPSNKKKSDGDTKPFTVDSDRSGLIEMPSITFLLNRKTLGNSGSSSSSQSTKKAPPPPYRASPPPLKLALPKDEPKTGAIALELPNSKPSTTTTPAATQSVPEIQTQSSAEISVIQINPAGLELETTTRQGTQAPFTHTQATASGAGILPGAAITSLSLSALSPTPAVVSTSAPTTLITPSARGRIQDQEPTDKLILWELSQLRAGRDPLGQGLVLLFEKGVVSALFLSITAPPPGSPVPHFNAKAAIQALARLGLWTGLKWDPTIVPELWNFFVKVGYVELGPPATMTNLMSNRNVVRGAFGIETAEYLTLVRAGPASACRGVIAIVSKKSVQAELAEALPLLTGKLSAST